ncbi:MAG: hypothetical protein QGH33_19100 [Pirellulaceae bacterium]|jgi:hypothetical protein|nr:hypothetical protein [Pirellulaceae bacterium]HJN11137.1 hypothetical protein [Pirellulaceae bacterium]
MPEQLEAGQENQHRPGGRPGVVADAWKVRNLTLTVRFKNGTRASTKPDKTVDTHPNGRAYFEDTAIEVKSEAPAIVLQFGETAKDSPRLKAKSCLHRSATARDLTSGRRTEE